MSTYFDAYVRTFVLSEEIKTNCLWNAFARWILDKRYTSRKTLDIRFSLSIRQEHVEYFARLRRRPELRVRCRGTLASSREPLRHQSPRTTLSRTSAARVAAHASAVNAMCRAGAASPPSSRNGERRTAARGPPSKTMPSSAAIYDHAVRVYSRR